MSTSKIVTVSRNSVNDNGEAYIEFHTNFRRRSFLSKLWAILKSIPSYIWYTWFAPENERYTYRALRSYLGRRIND